MKCHKKIISLSEEVIVDVLNTFLTRVLIDLIYFSTESFNSLLKTYIPTVPQTRMRSLDDIIDELPRMEESGESFRVIFSFLGPFIVALYVRLCVNQKKNIYRRKMSKLLNEVKISKILLAKLVGLDSNKCVLPQWVIRIPCQFVVVKLFMINRRTILVLTGHLLTQYREHMTALLTRFFAVYSVLEFNNYFVCSSEFLWHFIIVIISEEIWISTRFKLDFGCFDLTKSAY